MGLFSNPIVREATMPETDKKSRRNAQAPPAPPAEEQNKDRGGGETFREKKFAKKDKYAQSGPKIFTKTAILWKN